MITDTWTVMWKEWKELLLRPAGFRGGAAGLLIFIGVFGIFLPLQAGRSWVESPILLVSFAWMPLLLVTSVIADSFAGERERHTLETLLASRLSDRAILFGKIGAAVGYGWGLTLIVLLLGLLAVNIGSRQDGFLVYSPEIGVSAVILSLLMAGLASSTGVLVSLRASTVRQAQQSLSVPIMLLFLVPFFGSRMLPTDSKVELARLLASADVSMTIVLIAAVLAALNAVLLAVAMARFQRARLILD